MKGIFCFLFVLLFVQGAALAKELSLYEEFDPQIEFKLEEPKRTDDTKNAEEKKNTGSAISESSIVENAGHTQTGFFLSDFFLTDEKHDQFLAENEQYALADSMLNQTWKLLVQKLNKKAYRKLWQNHKVWLDTGRNTVANSFKEQVPQIPEYHAFMLATVAKTQELAQDIWHEPVLGRYVKGETFVTLTKEDTKIILQGYGNISYLMNTVNKEKTDDTEKNDTANKSAQADKQSPKEQKETDKSLKNSDEAGKKLDESNKKDFQTMPQLLFRAELPEQGKLWLALATVNEQKLYLLTSQDRLCIVHTPALFPVDFNGVFVKK